MRLIKANICLLFILLFANQSLWGSQESIRPSGLMGPRALAMGGSNVALPGYSNAGVINPASLVFISWPAISTGFGQQDLGDQQVWYVNGTMPIISKLVGQINVLSTTNPLNHHNKISNYNLSLAFPVSPNGQLLAGITGKFVSYDFNLPAGIPSGGGVDLGLIYTIWENEQYQALRLGISMIDAQTIVKLNSQSFILPTVFRYGLSWHLPEQWITTLEFNNQQSSDPAFDSFSMIRLGLEKTIAIPSTEGLAARIGFFHRQEAHSAITLGVGLGFKDWRIDYAMQLPTDFYNAYHQVGVSWGLDRLNPTQTKIIDQSQKKKKSSSTVEEESEHAAFFSALESAADVDDEFEEIVFDQVDQAESADETDEYSDEYEDSNAAYNLPVPEGPAAQEQVSIGVEPEMPASFSGYFSGSGSQFQIVKEDVRLHIVINPFSPNNDGKQDKTIFVGRLVNERLRVSKWQLYILRSSEVIRRFNGGRRLPRNLEWDGRDDRGKVLRDGSYQTILRLLDENGLEIASASELVEIRTRPKPITMTGPSRVKLSGGSSDQPLTFKIPRVLGSSNWRFMIVSPTGKRIYEKSGSKAIPKEIKWKPRRKGKPVAQGSFQAVLHYRDSVGLKSKATTSFKITYARFNTNLKASPALFKPAKAGGKSVTFDLQIKGKVTVKKWILKIINEKTKRAVRTYSQSGRPPKTLIWDGLNEAGKAVAGGQTYSGQFVVTTSLGTKAAADSESLQCDIGAYSGKKALSVNLVRLLFEPGQSSLNDKAKSDLSQAAQTINSYNMEYQLQITGHADILEGKDKADTLSRNRADNVANYLINSAEIPSEKIQVVGRGVDQLMVKSGEANERQKNRRVEVMLLAK